MKTNKNSCVIQSILEALAQLVLLHRNQGLVKHEHIKVS